METTTRSWGIISNIEGVTSGLVINSIDTSESISTAEALNEKGQVTDITGYSKKKTISVTGYLDSSKGELATAGSILTIDNKNYLIDSVSKKESNSSYVQVTISAQTADNAIITVIE